VQKIMSGVSSWQTANFPLSPVQGGLLFFSLKTLMKMYLRQQEYRRQGFRRVLDYDPSWDK